MRRPTHGAVRSQSRAKGTSVLAERLLSLLHWGVQERRKGEATDGVGLRTGNIQCGDGQS